MFIRRNYFHKNCFLSFLYAPLHLRWIYTVSVFCPFSSVFLRFSYLKKYSLFHPHFYKSISALSSSSIARGVGGWGGSSFPRWPEKYAKSHVFRAFEADFCSKNENSPPKKFGSQSCERVTGIWPEKSFELVILAKKSVSISVKTFFFVWRSPVLGRKIRFNFRFRPKNLSQFQWRPFFLDHLFLGGKTASILFKNNENLGQGR